MFVRPCLPLLATTCALALGAASVLHSKPVVLATETAKAPMTNSAVTSTPALFETFLSGKAQFDTTTHPLPYNVPALDFEATATSEFGDHIQLGGVAHYIDTVTVTFSSGAIRSDFPGSSPLGFTHPITLRIYAVDRSTGEVRLGDVLASVTRPFLIPWRPEPDTSVAMAERPWRGRDGQLYTGLAFNLTFDLDALDRALPAEIIFGLSFNTRSQGIAPIGTPGPYDFLRVGVTQQTAEPGTDPEPSRTFWKTNTPALYADGGVGGVNVFRVDGGWAPYKPAVRFTNSPYGTIAEAAALIRTLQSADPRRADALREAGEFVTQALIRGLWDGNNRLQVDDEDGTVVFDLLAEATPELAAMAESDEADAPAAQRVLDSLLRVSETLAETALGDAIMGAGNARHISRAQGAMDHAYANELEARNSSAVDAYAEAWREAQLSLSR